MAAPLLSRLYLGISVALYLYELHGHPYGYYRAFKEALVINAAFILSLFTSITVYRTCFHRLRPFPGPFLARTSKLWHSWQVRYSTNHLLLEKLHKEYGTFVRTGKTRMVLHP